MDVQKIIRENWKGAVVGLAVGAATVFASPVAGKIVGKVLPAALSHVSDTPITAIKKHEPVFSKEKITHDPPTVIIQVSPRDKARIADAARDHGATLRWQCIGLQK